MGYEMGQKKKVLTKRAGVGGREWGKGRGDHGRVDPEVWLRVGRHIGRRLSWCARNT